LRYDERLATFVPDTSPLAITPAGAANGCFGIAAALADGHACRHQRRGAARLQRRLDVGHAASRRD
jgi:hypothetical protein